MGNEAASAKEFDAVRGLQKEKQEGTDLAMKVAVIPPSAPHRVKQRTRVVLPRRQYAFLSDMP